MTFFCARNRKKGCFRQFLSSQAKDSVWPVSSAFSRQRSDIRQCRRPSSPQPGQTEWCAPPGGGRGKDGRRRGSCRGRICSRRRPSFPFLFPMRCTIPQANAVSERNPLLAREPIMGCLVPLLAVPDVVGDDVLVRGDVSCIVVHSINYLV